MQTIIVMVCLGLLLWIEPACAKARGGWWGHVSTSRIWARRPLIACWANSNRCLSIWSCSRSDQSQKSHATDREKLTQVRGGHSNRSLTSNSNDEGADMGGKAETVSYSRFFVKKFNNQKEKDDLKKIVNDIIDSSKVSLTIIALEGDKELDDRFRNFPGPGG